MYDIIIKMMILIEWGILLLPFNIYISKKFGLIDKPNNRRINKIVMPNSGGITIYIVYLIGLFIFREYLPISLVKGLIYGGSIILITGLLDDKYELSALKKLVGISFGIIAFLLQSNKLIENFYIPFLDVKIDLGNYSFLITFIWILAITNAVNLIDGLDGLASGTTIISSFTLGIIGYFNLPQPLNMVVFIQAILLMVSILGFLPYNFYPAKIYLGDSGALFIGFVLGVIGIQGVKNATALSFIIPMIIIGIPITDTFYAIIRRKFSKKKVSEADSEHLHHRLLNLGFSHKRTVILIYLLTILFSFIALMVYYSEGIATILLIIGLLLGVEIFIELIGLLGEGKKPIINWIKKLIIKIKEDK